MFVLHAGCDICRLGQAYVACGVGDQSDGTAAELEM